MNIDIEIEVTIGKPEIEATIGKPEIEIVPGKGIKTVGILGGSFNPPHFGHADMATIALSAVHEVWFMPVFSHMHGKDLASFDDRLEMIHRMVEDRFNGQENVKISNFEKDHEITDGTYVMMRMLREAYPNHRFYFIVGSADANKIHTWAYYKELREEFSFLIIPRYGQEGAFDHRQWYHEHPHLILNNLETQWYQDGLRFRRTIDCSSTELREKARAAHAKDKLKAENDIIKKYEWLSQDVPFTQLKHWRFYRQKTSRVVAEMIREKGLYRDEE